MAASRMQARLGKGSIGRRLIGLFLLAALLPLASLALYSLSKVSTELTALRQAELVQMSKGYGMGVAERLRQAEEWLYVSREAGSTQRALAVLKPYIGKELIGAIVVRDGRIVERIGNTHALQPKNKTLSGTDLRLLNSGDQSPVQMSVPAYLGGEETTVVALIHPAYLWSGSEELPNATDIAIISKDGNLLNQSRHMPMEGRQAVHRNFRAGKHSGALGIGTGDEERYIGYWVLSLTTMGGDAFVIAASQPASYVNAGIESFNSAFIPIALFAALGATLLAITQIRRLLKPLDALRAAATRVAQNDFSEPLDIQGSKELVAVGGAFNAMTRQIGRQLATLNSYAEIDRIVLTTLDVPAVVGTALRDILALSEAESAAILLKEAQGDTVRRYVLSGTGANVVEQRMYGSTIDLLNFKVEQSPQSDASAWKSDGRFVYTRPIGDIEDAVGLLLLNSNSPLESNEAQSRQIDGFLDRVAVAIAAERRERLLLNQAHCDSLTGLPNRLHFLQMLEAAVAAATREGRGGVLLFLDLDQFKRANDVLGHMAGDAVLKMSAERLQAVTRPGDLLARLGGDEFTLLCDGDPTEAQTEALAQALIESLRRPFEVDGRSVFVGLSIGSVRFPRDGDNAMDLLRRADTAMYCAKEAGGLRHASFRPAMEKEVQGGLALEQALRDALRDEQFELHYQVQLSTQDDSVVAAEALIRWVMPDGSIRSTAQWIRYVEQTPLIHDIGGWAITRACMQMRAWDDAGCRIQRVAVNVAARQLEEAQFYSRVVQALERAELAPNRLELEITESQLMASPEQGIAVLRRLAELGVIIAVDDFGTGYSSFSQLRHLPITVMKIDRSLVLEIDTSAEASAVLLAIVQMAHALRFTVIAEGVESPAEQAALRRMGCNAIQGFLVGVPMAADSFMRIYSSKLAGTVRPPVAAPTLLQVVASNTGK